VARQADGTHVAGGLLLQHLPEGEEGRDRIHTRLDHPEWDHVDALGGSVRLDELTDPALPLETLIWRLFNEDEVRVLPTVALSRGCRCDPDHVRSVIERFPAEEEDWLLMGTGSSISIANSAHGGFRWRRRSPERARSRFI
jgi:molecular chaperone Hsp33